VTPQSSLPVGVVFYEPAPERRAGERTDHALTQQGVPTNPRPRTPAPNPPSPTTEPRARRVLEPCKAHQPDVRMHAVRAQALDGTATVGEGASALLRGVPGIAPIRRPQNLRVGTRDQHVAASCATPPATPSSIRLRGGEAVGARGGRARWSVGAHPPNRVIVASTDAAEATSRARLASDLSGRTRARVQGHTRRGLVAVFMQDGTASEGWRPLPQPPGDEGARHRVILRLRVDPRLCRPPDPQRPLHNHLPAYTGGSRRAHVHVACLVDGIGDLGSSAHPQAQLKRCPHAWPEVVALGHSTQHLIQRPWGRLDPPLPCRTEHRRACARRL
jgi:hypothetical protein